MAGGAGAAPAAAEQTEFDVVLTGFGDKKLNVVKVVRNITGVSLMDAKKLVEAAPATLKQGVSKAEAEKLKAELEEAALRSNSSRPSTVLDHDGSLSGGHLSGQSGT